ncbi:metal homeostatis protein bsd2 [Blastomyces gilchristii SLH14081]|uniref:Metal homeostatis protein bsd2 n=1 Tax=Blastomyces gilchristii (strain SLH14081) TaxID=559298 RepID=A0A179U6U2_BLAGS|nr:metal homeostatis protein bsd2 [Blastomyces gilchristii SLH14081]OAT03694.1 metal homeostatis protein bsd2 [Blastomyces gilchristii SLH14081]
MSAHRYQRVDGHDVDDDDEQILHPVPSGHIPTSPPPSFHSRSPSPPSRRLLSHDPLHSEADQTLVDTFGDDDEDSDAEDGTDDRQRLMRGSTSPPGDNGSTHFGRGGNGGQSQGVSTTGNMAQAAFNPPVSTSSRTIHGAGTTNDGVFANLAAKPERGEKTEDLPPTYEQAAADATPPYWETTIVAPGMSSDEVYVDGLPVGSIFSFIWNGMISTSFQLVGFLLTYLLHTTHAAKNGSRAGLGLTLVQYGFYMKGSSEINRPSEPDGGYATPPDPNSHNFDPNKVGEPGYDSGADSGSSKPLAGITTSEWVSYVLMIVGWFILIRAVSDFLRARRHEQLVLQSPDRGLGVPVVAEGERAETVV